MYVIYIYIYIYICTHASITQGERGASDVQDERDRAGGPPLGFPNPPFVVRINDTGNCEKDLSFLRAQALQSSDRNCNPAPDLVF